MRASLEVGRRAVAVVVSCAGLAAGATACGTARPEFLRIDVSGQEHTVFTGYNRPLTLTPPPADQTISTAQLRALGARAQS